jgi:hypothetical protein
VIVAKLPPLGLHSGTAGIEFPDPLRRAGREDFYCIEPWNDRTIAC